MDLSTAVSILSSHALEFVAAYIFGSVARGDEDEHSDLDLILVRETDLPFFDRMREIMPLRRRLGKADIWIYTPDELESMLAEPGRYFVKDAVRKGCRIEGKQHGSPEVAPAG